MSGTPAGAPAQGSRAVEQEIEIGAPVAAVWKALTDAEELMRWFPPEARVTPGKGGSIWMRWADHYDAESEIEIWEPERHLRSRFPAEGSADLATDYYLAGRGGGTVLRVVTSGFGPGAEWDEFFAGVMNGWKFELRSLRHYLENHRGLARLAVRATTPFICSREEAWTRITGPGGWFNADGQTQVSVGDHYRTHTTSGDELHGVVQGWMPPRQFFGTVEGMNNALLRIQVDAGADAGTATLWLSTYGVAEADVRAVERAWQASLDSLFPAST